ncbi:MAG: hypothetical protein LC808_10370 [Actinobacteria bacterium]|nr:hypothetical protein [Actinomycetota bacterium]
MSSNERLRGSMAAAGLRAAELAGAVDAKTVERWVTAVLGRDVKITRSERGAVDDQHRGSAHDPLDT